MKSNAETTAEALLLEGQNHSGGEDDGDLTIMDGRFDRVKNGIITKPKELQDDLDQVMLFEELQQETPSKEDLRNARKPVYALCKGRCTHKAL